MPDKKGRQCNHCHQYFDDTTTEGVAHLASCRKYNGWTNYETWAVALWLDNDEGAYKRWGSAARAAMREAADQFDDLDEDATETVKRERADKIREIALRTIAGQLKREHEELAQRILTKGGGKGTVFSDLSSAALSEVDWQEVAESRLEA
jgi:hypothetical protein